MQLPVNSTDIAADSGELPPIPVGPGVPWGPSVAFYECTNVEYGPDVKISVNASIPVYAAQQYRRAYRAATSWTDFNVGRLLAEVEAIGATESTTIVFFGDQ